MIKLDDICIKSEDTLMCALKKISSNGLGIVFVIQDGNLFGSMTDGDIRRALINGASNNLSVGPLCNQNVIYEHISAPDINVRNITNNSIRVVPLVDDNKKIVDFATLTRPHNVVVMEPSLTGNELEYVTDCLKTNWISSQGSYVNLFENRLAKFFGSKHCLAVSNGTVALHLGLKALGIGVGDEVITSNLTFGASVNSIIHSGARPVLVDVDRDTWNISPKLIEKAITSDTKAIMPVHLYGNPCEMIEIMRIAKKYDLKVIEDCAEAFGATIGGKRVGTFGDVSTVSFFANKIITTGEGGSVQINDDNIYLTAKKLRDHGMSPNRRYFHEIVGYNYRLTNVQSAIGCAQLEQLNEFTNKRTKVFQRYHDLFAECEYIQEQYVAPENVSANWLYTICLKGGFEEERDNLISHLKSQGIDTRAIFYPMNEMPAFLDYLNNSEFPISRAISYSGISLPSSINITDDEIKHVVDTVLNFFI